MLKAQKKRRKRSIVLSMSAKPNLTLCQKTQSLPLFTSHSIASLIPNNRRQAATSLARISREFSRARTVLIGSILISSNKLNEIKGRVQAGRKRLRTHFARRGSAFDQRYRCVNRYRMSLGTFSSHDIFIFRRAQIPRNRLHVWEPRTQIEFLENRTELEFDVSMGFESRRRRRETGMEGLE